jgi:hypothetical protein
VERTLAEAGQRTARPGMACGREHSGDQGWHAGALVMGDQERDGAAQEGTMIQQSMRRWVFVSLLGGMFLGGFVMGSISQRAAQAQVPGMGGALGSVQELGTSIGEIQQHIEGLQKNLTTLKKVQASLGGGK